MGRKLAATNLWIKKRLPGGKISKTTLKNIFFYIKMFDYVCVNKECDLVSNRVKVLETLSGFKSHASVIKSCILIQKKVRIFMTLLKINRVKKIISQKIILKYTKQFVEKKKTNRKNLLVLKLKNKLRTICYKKRFRKMKNSSIYIQYMFK